MKKLVALLSSSAVALAASPAPSTAPQNIRQDVNRLVLLPGPYLTSPAKGAPQPTPVSLPAEGMVKIGAEPTFRLQPEPTKTTSGLKLGSGAEKKKEFAPAAPKPAAPKDPEELRFGEKLPATTPPSLLKPKPTQPATGTPRTP